MDIYYSNIAPNFGQMYILDVLLTKIFDGGRREEFEIAWKRFIPFHIRTEEKQCLKLEFYIMIYFAVFPIHPCNSNVFINQPSLNDLSLEMSAFKEFLETRGSNLSKTSEFLPYYALPYIKHPSVLFNRKINLFLIFLL